MNKELREVYYIRSRLRISRLRYTLEAGQEIIFVKTTLPKKTKKVQNTATKCVSPRKKGLKEFNNISKEGVATNKILWSIINLFLQIRVILIGKK